MLEMCMHISRKWQGKNFTFVEASTDVSSLACKHSPLEPTKTSFIKQSNKGLVFPTYLCANLKLKRAQSLLYILMTRASLKQCKWQPEHSFEYQNEMFF